MKKAMMATWSDSEESSEEEKEKEVANMYFMAIDELDEVNSNFSDEDIEVTSIKVAYKGHRNSRSKKLDQATCGGAHRVINDI